MLDSILKKKGSFFFKFLYTFGTAKVIIIPLNVAANGVRFLDKSFTIRVFYHLCSHAIFSRLLIRFKKERNNKVQNNKKDQNVKNYSHGFNISIDVKLNKSRQLKCSLTKIVLFPNLNFIHNNWHDLRNNWFERWKISGSIFKKE